MGAPSRSATLLRRALARVRGKGGKRSKKGDRAGTSASEEKEALRLVALREEWFTTTKRPPVTGREGGRRGKRRTPSTPFARGKSSSHHDSRKKKKESMLTALWGR